MKKIISICIFTIFISIIISGMLFLFVISGAVFSLMPTPPKPEITYREFPFRLEYEINGENIVIEDVLICEFDGFKSLGAAGKYRKWNIYTKSSGERMIKLLDVREKNDYTDWGNQVLELCFDPGNAEYYMGDVEYRQRDGTMCEWVDYLHKKPDGTTGYSAFELDEAWEKYKIRLISWEVAPPIENTFK